MHGRQQHEIPAFQRRLDRQARDTRALRSSVYALAGLDSAGTLLDVGCGSGAVTRELAQWGGRVQGVDLDERMVRKAAAEGVEALHADGAALPFADASFDAAVCNLVLLWASEPQSVVAEMARVVRPGGVVVASMEPDYGGKIHWPSSPLADAVFRGRGVAQRGGDPDAGRKLRQRFVQAGLVTDVGISNASVPTTEQDLANFLRHRSHYRRLLRESGFAPADVALWEREYVDALEAGVALCFLPMFYAIGRKPGGELQA